MRWRLHAAAALAAAAFLTGCATAPRHPALAEAALPPLLPVRSFVANVDEVGGFSLSPDGRSLLWRQTVGTDAGLAVRRIEGGETRRFATGFLARPAGPTYTWLPDSRHVAFLKDLQGDENTRLHVFDSERPFAPWEVTPWPGVRSTFAGGGAPGSAKFFFVSNRRDRSTMDLYEADAATRSVREVARSDGLVTAWMIGTDHQLAGRYRQLQRQDGARGVLEVLQADGSWRAVRESGGFDQLWVERIDRSHGKAWVFSNAGRDRSALLELDLASGRETVLGEHPVVDLGWAFTPRGGGSPVATVADAGMSEVRYLDAALGADVERAVARAQREGLLDGPPRFTRPQSSSLDGRRWVVRALDDYEAAELLVDRDSGQVTRLDPKEGERRRILSPRQPYQFQASDGRTIHGYVVRPRGVAGPAPLVVNIHGGPWARDSWSPAEYDTDQLLANRGYAVLRVNYRGSSGYGREHLQAGFLKTYGRVQEDIAEAAQWAVRQGIADPARMGVLGASFGGFSVLAQLAQRPQQWRCGVNLVGVANWPRVIENWPPFWRSRHYFKATYGDVDDPAQRASMLENSPITHVDRIVAPLLVIHGANDVRVLKQDSDDVVARLRELGRPVNYLVFANEGHAIRRWRNRLETWRRIEDHFAACLGGRSAGWDFYELMPR